MELQLFCPHPYAFIAGTKKNFTLTSRIGAIRRFLPRLHTEHFHGTRMGRKSRRYINPLTPNDHYSGRTAPLTSKRCILYIYSTNTDTEYFNHGVHSPFFSRQDAICFIILMYLVPVLFTFYVENVLKYKKIIQTRKG